MSEWKKESERLITRYVTFLNYDSILNVEWKDPNDKSHQKKVRKEAKKLASIAVEEILNIYKNCKTHPMTVFYKKVQKELLKNKNDGKTL